MLRRQIKPRAMKQQKKAQSIEEYLLDKSTINSSQLDKAIQYAETNKMSLQQSIVSLNLATEQDITAGYEEIAAKRVQTPTADDVDLDSLRVIPEHICRQHRFLPLKSSGAPVPIAMVNPLDTKAITTIQTYLLKEIEIVLITDSHFEKLSEQFFDSSQPTRRTNPTGNFQIQPPQPPQPTRKNSTTSTSIPTRETNPSISTSQQPSSQVIQKPLSQRKPQPLSASEITPFLSKMFRNAISKGVSDIHIEPVVNGLRVRHRVDGQLVDTGLYRKEVQNELISKLKIMANLDIAEKRLPQDGKLEFNPTPRDHFNFRISTYPLNYGEKVVLRFHDQSTAAHRLDELGMADTTLERFIRVLHKQHGMFLVTGPTGSGKTTTLYAAMHEINDNRLNIITIEDPIEYELDNVNQSSVNPKAGLTFPLMLRSLLRQDPDVILVGEIRDLETSQLAFRAAMTGHLVLSALHANDATSTVTRLLNLGTEAHLVASSVNGIDAQRLLRKTCQHCCERRWLTEEELRLLEMIQPNHGLRTSYEGQGCDECNSTGCKGRIGVFEFMVISEGIEFLIMDKAPASRIKDLAIKEGMTTMQQDALNKFRKEMVSFEAIKPIMISG